MLNRHKRILLLVTLFTICVPAITLGAKKSFEDLYYEQMVETDDVRAQMADLKYQDDILLKELYPEYLSYYREYLEAQKRGDTDAMDFYGRLIAQRGVAIEELMKERENVGNWKG